MNLSLVLAALLMGLAGALHCSAMCGAACTALAQRGGRPASRALLGFHLGRLASYAAGGALAAASVGALASWSQAAPVLRPLWSLVHAAALMLGLWLAWSGRQPAWLTAWGQAPTLAPAAAAGAWQPVQGPRHGALGATLAGSAWVALPCGLLQSALLVAALGSSALGGAAVMAGFALTSSLGLLLVGAAWQRHAAGPGALRWAVRLAGVMLAASSVWALGHDPLQRFVAYCLG